MPNLSGVLALTLCLLSGGQEKAKRQAPPPPAKKVMRIVCTNNSVQCEGEPVFDSKNPIVTALNLAAPGAHIELRAGDYRGFCIGPKSKNCAHDLRGTAGAPIVVQGERGVRISANSSALDVTQDTRCGFVTFQDVEFLPGKQAAIRFLPGENWVHQGFHFIRCDIDGDAAPAAAPDAAQTSHAGVVGWGLADFLFQSASVSDLDRGNAFDFHQPRGAVTIDAVRAARIGLSFIELTSAADDGEPGQGTITISNCDVEDCGLIAGDSKEGQSAFSFGGRHRGEIVLRRNTYRAGFVESLRSTSGRAVYGTGALELWCGADLQPTRRLTLDTNVFEMFDGCGDRALVAISACGTVEFQGSNRFIAGANRAALEVEPIRRSRPDGSPIDKLAFAKRPHVEGPITWRNTAVSLWELADIYPGSDVALGK